MTDLTTAQISALRDANRGPLWRTRGGWQRRGAVAHPPQTVAALARRRLVRIDPDRRPRASATITRSGLMTLAEAGRR